MTFAPTLIVTEDRTMTMPARMTTNGGNLTISSTGFQSAVPYNCTVTDVTAMPTNENSAIVSGIDKTWPSIWPR